MGWCSATGIFDAIAEKVLSEKKIDKKEILSILIDILEDYDWDCQSDSDYYEHPLVQEIFKEKHSR